MSIPWEDSKDMVIIKYKQEREKNKRRIIFIIIYFNEKLNCPLSNL